MALCTKQLTQHRKCRLSHLHELINKTLEIKWNAIRRFQKCNRIILVALNETEHKNFNNFISAFIHLNNIFMCRNTIQLVACIKNFIRNILHDWKILHRFTVLTHIID